jgi:hypothetical protein
METLGDRGAQPAFVQRLESVAARPPVICNRPNWLRRALFISEARE